MRRNIFEVKNVNKGLFYLFCKGLRSGPAQNKTINANTPQKKTVRKLWLQMKTLKQILHHLKQIYITTPPKFHQP